MDQLAIKKLSERKNKVYIEKDHIPVTQKPANLSELGQKLIEKTAGRIRLAWQEKRSVMLTFGAHTIKNGMAPTLISLMEEGWVTHLSTNGAGIIHDWEFAFQGKSSKMFVRMLKMASLESGMKPAFLSTLLWL